MKKVNSMIKWKIRGLKALIKSRNTKGHNAFSRWKRAEDGRKNGRHSRRMEENNERL